MMLASYSALLPVNGKIEPISGNRCLFQVWQAFKVVVGRSQETSKSYKVVLIEFDFVKK